MYVANDDILLVLELTKKVCLGFKIGRHSLFSGFELGTWTAAEVQLIESIRVLVKRERKNRNKHCRLLVCTRQALAYWHSLPLCTVCGSHTLWLTGVDVSLGALSCQAAGGNNLLASPLKRSWHGEDTRVERTLRIEVLDNVLCDAVEGVCGIKLAM